MQEKVDKLQEVKEQMNDLVYELNHLDLELSQAEIVELLKEKFEDDLIQIISWWFLEVWEFRNKKIKIFLID